MRKVAWKLNAWDPTIASYRNRCFIPARQLERLGAKVRIYGERDPVDLREKIDALIFVEHITERDLDLIQRARAKGTKVFVDICDNLFERTEVKFGSMKATFFAENLLKALPFLEGIITTGQELASALRLKLGTQIPIAVIPDGLERECDLKYTDERIARRKREWLFDHGIGWFLYPGIGRLVEFGWGRLTDSKAWRKASDASRPKPQPLPAGPKLLWFGSMGVPGIFGMTDLLLIKDALQRVHKKTPFTLVVVSSNEALYREVVAPFPFPTVYVPWSLGGIYRILREVSVTLVPNPQSEFTKGKSANRSILSLYCGVPVVATRTEALEPFSDCLVLDNWEEGILTYLNDPTRRELDIKKAKSLIEKSYNPEILGSLWYRVLVGDANALKTGAVFVPRLT